MLVVFGVFSPKPEHLAYLAAGSGTRRQNNWGGESTGSMSKWQIAPELLNHPVTQESPHDGCLGQLYCLQGCAESLWGLGNVSSLLRQEGGLSLQVVWRQESK